MTFTEDQETRHFDFRERRGLIEKDVARTDRSVAYFTKDENLDLMRAILMTYCALRSARGAAALRFWL